MLVIAVAFTKRNIVMMLSLSGAGVLNGFVFLYSLAFAFSLQLYTVAEKVHKTHTVASLWQVRFVLDPSCWLDLWLSELAGRVTKTKSEHNVAFFTRRVSVSACIQKSPPRRQCPSFGLLMCVRSHKSGRATTHVFCHTSWMPLTVIRRHLHVISAWDPCKGKWGRCRQYQETDHPPSCEGMESKFFVTWVTFPFDSKPDSVVKAALIFKYLRKGSFVPDIGHSPYHNVSYNCRVTWLRKMKRKKTPAQIIVRLWCYGWPLKVW